LALLTAHLPRRPMILAMVALYALGHVLCALAPNYAVLLTARILVALTHGLFFGNATIAAASVVPRERRGSAIAIVLAGVPLANLLGVPVGAVIGHWLGWRASFGASPAWAPSRWPQSRSPCLRSTLVPSRQSLGASKSEYCSATRSP
jgi:DHA1 family inner membrane transport protein